MLRDGRQVDHRDEVRVDVCIIGAGPAGLAAARELDGDGRCVCLLESGGSEPNDEIQALADAPVEPNIDGYLNPRYLRELAVGGTAHRWPAIVVGDDRYFRVGTLEPADFEARSWIPHSGWPVEAGTIKPFYRRALDLCGLGSAPFDSPQSVDRVHAPIVQAGERVESGAFLFARQRLFTEVLPRQIAASADVTLLTHSTCVELESADGGSRVTRARVRTLSGREFFVTARAFVLAQGGFEVPRLLLASRSEVRSGLGNQHDLVGRFFSDHQLVKAGRIVSAPPNLATRLAHYDIRRHGDVSMVGMLRIAEKTLDEEEILSSAIIFSARSKHSPARFVQRPFGRETTARSAAMASAVSLKRSVTTRTRPHGLVRHLSNLVGGVDDLLYAATRYRPLFQPRYSIDRGGWSDPIDHGTPGDALTIEAFQLCEQAPSPSNRITLTADVDPLGVPKAALRFSWNELDRHSVARSQQIFSQSLANAGVGQLSFERRDGDPLVRQISAHHPSGTTRMSDSASTGVVDADNRVHGTSNLFVASSSVFPTAGYAPPTLTIIALAMRLTDHIAELLDHGRLPLAEQQRPTSAA